MRTLGQKRAAFALDKVLNNGCSEPAKFEKFTAGAPSMILQNGFGQALAFWYSKGKDNKGDKHRVLLDIVREWLCSDKEKDISNKFIKPCASPQEMVKSLSEMSQEEYLSAQKETLALLEWIKRYANALLAGD